MGRLDQNVKEHSDWKDKDRTDCPERKYGYVGCEQTYSKRKKTKKQ